MAMRSCIRINVAVAATLLLLAACGGGGYSGDTKPSTPPTADAAGLDRFLLFPNPQADPEDPGNTKAFQTNTLAYAQAYYQAIDPNNERTTLEDWKRTNGFYDVSENEKIVAVFGDKRDLGYGRRMTAWYSAQTKSVAFFVENYVVNPGEAYGYSPLSLEAAEAQDTRWRIGINAIEFSGPDGKKFAKFFNFNSKTGTRDEAVNLDFRGDKYMPGPCITCHGGRGDALDANKSFATIQNSQSGDVLGHLVPIEVESLDFLSETHKQSEQNDLKRMNELVLCTYPGQTACGSVANANPKRGYDWESKDVAKRITQAYPGKADEPVLYVEPPIPNDWVAAGQSTLYSEVVVPYCRMCHMLRGTNQNGSIAFETYSDFINYADRIKVHVFDRGNMPLAKLVYDNFWASNAPEILAAFLKSQPRIPDVIRNPATGRIAEPGTYPIADPGPDRIVAPGKTVLSASASLFSKTYSWSIVSGAGASLANPNLANPTFEATVPGVYEVELIAYDGATASAPERQKIRVNLGTEASPNLTTVKGQFVTCTNLGCHDTGSTTEPVVWDTADYETIKGRVNFTDVAASPLLRKPSSSLHHNGGLQTGFDISKDVADANPNDRKSYDALLTWILNGARPQ